MTDFQQWVMLVRDGGLSLAVVALIVGGIRGWYVWKPTLDDMRDDRDQWRELALKGTSLAERALDIPAPRKR